MGASHAPGEEHVIKGAEQEALGPRTPRRVCISNLFSISFQPPFGGLSKLLFKLFQALLWRPFHQEASSATGLSLV